MLSPANAFLVSPFFSGVMIRLSRSRTLACDDSRTGPAAELALVSLG